MSRSCVHPVLHTEWHSCHRVNASKPQRKPKAPTPPIKHHPVDFTDTACWSMLSRVYETERCPSVRLPRMNPLQQNSCWRFAAASPGKRYRLIAAAGAGKCGQCRVESVRWMLNTDLFFLDSPMTIKAAAHTNSSS